MIATECLRNARCLAAARRYVSATKMKEVPVPFAYVQVNALLLLVFNSLTPIAIACFSSPDKSPSDDGTFDDDYDRTLHVFVSCVLSMVVVAGFTAMWLVANELEDPFGTDANDIDVLTYHRKFVSTLDHLCNSGGAATLRAPIVARARRASQQPLWPSEPYATRDLFLRVFFWPDGHVLLPVTHCRALFPHNLGVCPVSDVVAM